MKTNVTYLIAAEGAARREGNYVVVPVVAMVEGVVHAMNASQPEFVPASELSAKGWDNRPIFVGHPMHGGYPVSGLHPAIAHTSIGVTKNPRVNGNRLLMEAWLDESKADQDLIDRILAGEPIDVSQGAFVRTEKVAGNHNGKDYFGVWRDIDPDHLALLPGARGACSWAMGCGIRAAMEHGTDEELRAAWPDPKTGIDDHGRGAHEAAAKAHEKAADAHEAAAEHYKNGGEHLAEDSNRTSAAAQKLSVKAYRASDAIEVHHAEASKAMERANAANVGRSSEESQKAHEDAAMHHRDAVHYHKYQANYTPRNAEMRDAWLDPKTGIDNHGREPHVGDKVTVRGNGGRAAVHGEGKTGIVKHSSGSFHSVYDKSGQSIGSYHSSDLTIHKSSLRDNWFDPKTGIDDHGRAGAAHQAAAEAHAAAAEAHLSGNTKGAMNATHAATSATEHASQMSGKTGYGQRAAVLGANHMSVTAHERALENQSAGHKYTASDVAFAHTEAAKYHQDAMRTHDTMRRPKAAEEGDVEKVLHCYAEWLEPGDETDYLLTVLRNIPQSVRDKMDKADFAGPNESFPIEQAIDVADAARAIGRAKGNRATIKRNIIAIAYRKGFQDSLPENWKRQKDQKAASGLLALINAAKNFFKGAQTADEMGKSDLMDRLRDGLQAVEPNFGGIVDYYPVTDPAHVVYVCYDGMETTTWERAFTLADSGVVTISDTKIEVEAVTTYEPVTGASPQRYLKAACSCQTRKEIDMTKQERIKALVAKGSKMFVEGDIKMLEGATDDQLARFEAAADADLKAAADAKAAKELADKAAKDAADKTAREAADKALLDAAKAGKASVTFEELLEKANPEVRAALKAAQGQVAAVKAETIKTLRASKRCTFTDEQLNAMDQAQLDSLVTLAGITVATSHALQLPPAAGEADLKVAAAPTNESFNAVVVASMKK